MDAWTGSPPTAHLQNPASGMGVEGARSAQSYWAQRQLTPLQIEACYQQSWAARKLVDIPVDDMWALGRYWTGDNEDTARQLDAAYKELDIYRQLAKTQKAARLYGTAFLVLVPVNQMRLADPLDAEAASPDDLANVWSVTRHSCIDTTWETDIGQPGYGQPYSYRLAPRLTMNRSGQVTRSATPDANPMAERQEHEVHHTRLLRFDYAPPPIDDGWLTGHDQGWGRSILERTWELIIRSATVHASAGHLVEEASIAVHKIQGYKEAIKGRPQPGEPTLDELATSFATHKSLWRMAFMDAEDDLARVDYGFHGLPDIMDRFAQLMAAAADIPATRFMGQSPLGMNATGESDAANYALSVAAEQERQLTQPLQVLDSLVAARAGVNDDLEYDWKPLTTLGDKEQAEADQLRTDTILAAIQAHVIDEDEARERLSGLDLWGELGAWSDDMLPAQTAFEEQRAQEAEQEMPDGF